MMSQQNKATWFHFLTLAMVSSLISAEAFSNSADRQIVTVEEAFEMVDSANQLEPEINVQIFPHDNDYAPHGIDSDRTSIELFSKDGICRIYSVNEVDHETKLQLLLQTKSILIQASKIKTPLFVKCSDAVTLKRKGYADDKNFSYLGSFTVTPVDVLSTTNKSTSKNSKRSKELMVVNHVSLSDYLRGVVPTEVSPSWPMESLKSQAVAARTYALFHIAQARKNNSTMGYDVDDTITYQAYTGTTHYHNRTDVAVLETKGEVLTYNDEIVQAFFHADSGGETESSEDVFVVPLPYISKVKEPKNYSKDYSATWEKTISLKELKKFFGPKSGAGDGLGLIENVVIEKKGRLKSGRVQELKLVFESGKTANISGAAFKKQFALQSLMFSIERRGNRFVVKGKGSGHGVGLNQTGALHLAKENAWSYREILDYYYPATKICQRQYSHDDNVEFTCAI